jgi:cob(I)alamin adenosyltransferase
MSSVTTGRGDRGLSDTRDHQRIPKFDPWLEAVGTVDELSCFAGALRVALQGRPELAASVLELQRDLYRLGAELATADPARLGNLRLLGPGDVRKLEQWIGALEAAVEPPAAFVLPGGGNPEAAAADVCRAVCRRAERTLTRFFAQQGSADGDISALVYLNRCSDYFFLLALSLADTRDLAGQNPTSGERK